MTMNLPDAKMKEEAWEFVAPPCPYFGTCGGCQLQHVSYASQLKWKHQRLVECLAGIVEPSLVETPIASPQIWNYRRRIQIHATPQGQPGFYGSGSAKVIPVSECKIAHEAINESLNEVEQRFHEIMERRQHSSRLGFELTVFPGTPVEIQALSEDRYFLQSNPGANELLHEHLQRHFLALAPKRVLELFAGAGNFTLGLSQGAMEWTAVESDPSAVAKGKELSLNLKKPVRWVEEKAHRYLKNRKGGGFDLVLLDPPRSGAKLCMPSLVKMQVPMVLYLSCAPEALATDLKILKNGGYQVTKVQAFDFFPHTTHLETLVLLRQVGPGTI